MLLLFEERNEAAPPGGGMLFALLGVLRKELSLLDWKE
jgi:hypothetical protein